MFSKDNKMFRNKTAVDSQPRPEELSNLKKIMNPEGKVHEWGDIPADQLPNASLLAGHAVPAAAKLAGSAVLAAETGEEIGRGSELFAKRKEKSDKWVVDESTIGKKTPSSFADQFVQEQTIQQQRMMQSKMMEEQERRQVIQQQSAFEMEQRQEQQQMAQQQFAAQQQYKQQQAMELRRQQEEMMAQMEQIELPQNMKRTDLKSRGCSTPGIDLGCHNSQGINVWANTAPRGWGTLKRESGQGSTQQIQSELARTQSEFEQNEREEKLFLERQQQEILRAQKQEEERMLIEEQQRIQREQEEMMVIQQQQEQLRIQQEQEQMILMQQQQEEIRRQQEQEEMMLMKQQQEQIRLQKEQEELVRIQQEQMRIQKEQEEINIRQQQEEQMRQMKQQAQANEQQKLVKSSSNIQSQQALAESQNTFQSQESSTNQQAFSQKTVQNSMESYESRRVGYETVSQSSQSVTSSKIAKSGVNFGISGDSNNLVSDEVDYQKHSVKDLAKHFAAVKPKAEIPLNVLPEIRMYNGQEAPNLNYLGANDNEGKVKAAFTRKEVEQKELEASRLAYEEKKRKQLEQQQTEVSNVSTKQTTESKSAKSVTSERRLSISSALMMDPAKQHAESGIIDPSAILAGEGGSRTGRIIGLAGSIGGATEEVSNKWDNHNTIARGWAGVTPNYHPVTFRNIYNVTSQKI